MKLLILLLPLLAAAGPLFSSKRTASPPQKALSYPQPLAQLSPASSFSTTSDIESNSDASSKSSKKSSFSSLFKSTTSEFKCHRYPDTTILSGLSTYITKLLRDNRESIFGSSNGGSDQERMFETCYAGYEAGDVNPSIYFEHLAKKQAVAVQTLLRNHGVAMLPKVEVLREGSVIAIVMRDGELGLKRRNTI